MLAISLSGLPVSLGALLVNLLAIAAVVCLPAAAIAAFTRNLWQYAPVVSAGAIAAIAVWYETYATFSGPVPAVVGAILLGTLSLAALLVQFHGRRTLRNAAVYVAAFAAVGLLVATFPRDLARSVESALDDPDARGSLTLGIAPPPRPEAAVAPPASGLARPPWQLRPVIRLPIEAWGVDFRDLILASPTVTLRTAAGETFPLAVNVWRDESGDSLITSSLILRDRMFGPRTLSTIATQIMNEPVSLHVELWVKRYSDTATATLPADGSALMLGGHEQCRAIRTGSRRLPPSLDAPPAVILDGAEVTVVRRERVAFFRATFDAENLRLAEYVWE
jgi:hypothetical protein